MEQKENLFIRAYKNLILSGKEKKSMEDELKLSKILDKKGGIFNISEDKIFNFGEKNDIFGGIKEKTIFDNKTGFKFSKNKQDNDAFESFNLKDIGFNKGETQPGLGNNFNQIG